MCGVACNCSTCHSIRDILSRERHYLNRELMTVATIWTLQQIKWYFPCVPCVYQQSILYYTRPGVCICVGRWFEIWIPVHPVNNYTFSFLNGELRYTCTISFIIPRNKCLLYTKLCYFKQHMAPWQRYNFHRPLNWNFWMFVVGLGGVIQQELRFDSYIITWSVNWKLLW